MRWPDPEARYTVLEAAQRCYWQDGTIGVELLDVLVEFAITKHVERRRIRPGLDAVLDAVAPLVPAPAPRARCARLRERVRA